MASERPDLRRLARETLLPQVRWLLGGLAAGTVAVLVIGLLGLLLGR